MPPSGRYLTKVLNGESEHFPLFSIIGSYAADVKSFVDHAALLSKEQCIKACSNAPVYHVMPPIVAGEISATHPKAESTTDAHLAANISLTPSELNAMKNWFANIDKQDRPMRFDKHYVLVPHTKWEIGKEKGRRAHQRFSCVGFVIECYRAAEIDLLDTNGELPEVDKITLLSAYPDFANIKNNERLSEDLGVPGEGPWRVVLPGYVFHSTCRASEANPRPSPYLPSSQEDGHYS